MLDHTGINYVAVLVVTVIGFLLGGVWYAPFAFGRRWLAAIGKTEKDLTSPAVPFTLSFVTGFLTAYTIALIITSLDMNGLRPGVSLGLYVGVGIIAASAASDYAFCRFRPSLFFIQGGYRVAYSVLSGAILAVWR